MTLPSDEEIRATVLRLIYSAHLAELDRTGAPRDAVQRRERSFWKKAEDAELKTLRSVIGGVEKLYQKMSDGAECNAWATIAIELGPELKALKVDLARRPKVVEMTCRRYRELVARDTHRGPRKRALGRHGPLEHLSPF
ncbi:MAG: hypothetical protein AAFY60_14810, partial [Myxococcota bacterium]